MAAPANQETLALPRLVLGSGSKGRAACLRAAGYEFEQLVADIDEKAVVLEDESGGAKESWEERRARASPEKLTVAIAKAKAAALEPQLRGQNCILITSDQVVHYNGRIREKPETPEMCRAYLKSYETEPACTVCGVVVTHMGTGRQATGVDVARQHFRPIPDDVAEALIAKGDVMYCCGGFLVDDPLIAPYLAEREGDEDSIIGMPMALTRPLIAEVIAPKQPA